MIEMDVRKELEKMGVKYSKANDIKRAYYRFKNSDTFTLKCAYKNPSLMKKWAYEKCLNIAKNVGSEHAKIVSYNTFSFTFGFVVPDDNDVFFVWVTQTKIRYISVLEEV